MGSHTETGLNSPNLSVQILTWVLSPFGLLGSMKPTLDAVARGEVRGPSLRIVSPAKIICFTWNRFQNQTHVVPAIPQ